jgi:hypothetical protein
VTLYETNARAIPDMLRQAATSIETEEAEGFSPTKAMVAVQIAENGQVQLYGWGDTEIMHSIALLQIGAAKLIEAQIAGAEE